MVSEPIYSQEMTMGKTFLVSVTIATIVGCASTGVKEHVESQLNGTIGNLPSKTFFHDSPRLKCSVRNRENGCLLESDYGCTIWFKVDKSTGVISSWEYVGRPENCWGFHGA